MRNSCLDHRELALRLLALSTVVMENHNYHFENYVAKLVRIINKISSLRDVGMQE